VCSLKKFILTTKDMQIQVGLLSLHSENKKSFEKPLGKNNKFRTDYNCTLVAIRTFIKMLPFKTLQWIFLTN
jgi:hypothetical protein